MVGDYVILLRLPAGDGAVLTLGKQKLLFRDGRIALVGADSLALRRLIRIFHIVQRSAQRLGHAPAFALVQRHQSCCRHVLPPIQSGVTRSG